MVRTIGFLSALLLCTTASAADSVSLGGPPALSARIATQGTPCSGVGTQAITPAGLPLSCQSGVWNLLGISNAEWVNKYILISGWPLPALVEAVVSCPAGKKIVGGGCNFNGYSNQVNLDESYPGADMTTWNCAAKVYSLEQQDPWTGLQAAAICANYAQ